MSVMTMESVSIRMWGRPLTKGGDLGINGNPWEWLAITGSYSYLEAKDEKTGLWLTAKPAHQVNVNFNFTPTQKLFFNLNLIYASKAYTNSANTKTVSDYLIANVRAEYFFPKIQCVFRDRKHSRYHLLLCGWPAGNLL